MAGNAVLTRDGPVPVPMDYKVPAGGELVPLTVRATIDGTGAASAFYASVDVIAPSGRIMGHYITSIIAAGASADATWFPGIGGAALGTIPGQVLQIYVGQAPASDFTWSNQPHVEVPSNFPTNTTFTKLRSDTNLYIALASDFVDNVAPDTCFLGWWWDGIIFENISQGVTQAGEDFAIGVSVYSGPNIRGADLHPTINFDAGPHTIQAYVRTASNGPCRMASSNAADLTVVEIVPP